MSKTLYPKSWGNARWTVGQHTKLAQDIGGLAFQVTFENGYRADIFQHAFTYGAAQKPWQLALLYGNKFVFDTPICDDVIQHCTEAKIVCLLDQIDALPPRVPA